MHQVQSFQREEEADLYSTECWVTVEPKSQGSLGVGENELHVGGMKSN